MDQSNHLTAFENRIPLQQKTAYAVGMFVNQLQAAALPAMMVILIVGLQMNPILVGWLGFIPRVFDAVTDPMAGYISDNARTRWGRRRPFIFVGALLAGLTFALMWQLYPGQSEMYYFWVFLAASLVFFLAYTFYATPFVAFGYEMTNDYHERTRLHSTAQWAGQLVWLGVPGFYWIMNNKSLFNDQVEGARTLAIVVGITIAILGMVPAIFCRERTAAREPAKHPLGFWQNLSVFFQGLWETLRCRPFVLLCLATFLVFNGYQLGSSFSQFIMIYYVFDGDHEKGGALLFWFGMSTSACSLFVIPLTSWLTTKIGKQRTFILTISISLVGYASKWIGYNPSYPYLLIASAPLVAFGIGSLFTLMGSMISDVCDYDELETNNRREGVFGAIYWWMVKVGMSVASLLTGYMLVASGFDVNLEGGQSSATLFYLRLFDIGVPLLTSGLALLLIAAYPITEQRAYEIQNELQLRQEAYKKRGFPVESSE